ncbi:MAG TPA: SCO family protein [Candidatus Caldiarchaeum subterraneum]|uniref:SCO family protein n=1 Tax=Caldiarchaeum subterraneum TaxID=311458 RepID=A0A832ZVN2_CALS0|nr:SCO family protein [Candidatus Caldarchaeum subterraneum]
MYNILRSRLLVIIPAAVVIAILASFIVASQFSPKPTYEPAIEIQGNKKLIDFTLIDQNGKPFTLSSVKGKVILLYFGYTNCPDVCPIVMSKFAYVLENLGPDADKVAFILVTTDPVRDTPEVMKRYVENYDPRIIALTGEPKAMIDVWRAYGIYVGYETPDEEGNYYVGHTAFVLAADKNMVIKFALTPEMPKEEYLQGVRWLLSL